MLSRRMAPSALALMMVAGCNDECITGTLTLHVAWSQTEPIHDACGSLVVDRWSADQGPPAGD